MKKWVKIIIKILVVIILIVISFYAGGIYGFFVGSVHHANLYASLHATQKVWILYKLRRGEVNDAIENLEMLLSIDVLEFSMMYDDDPIPFSLFYKLHRNENLMKCVKKYYEDYPNSKELSPTLPDSLENTRKTGK